MGAQPSAAAAAATTTTAAAYSSSDMLEMYPIRLEPEQSLQLFGFMRPKRTLTWRDVVENRGITLGRCIAAGIPAERLCRMQPDIHEWLRHNKLHLTDCPHVEPWKVNVFTDLKLTLGELIRFRQSLPPKLLVESGIDFQTLRRVHGLTPEHMIVLKYTTEDWVNLRIDEAFLSGLSDEHWRKLFGATSRDELIAMVQLHHQNNAGKKI